MGVAFPPSLALRPRMAGAWPSALVITEAQGLPLPEVALYCDVLLTAELLTVGCQPVDEVEGPRRDTHHDVTKDVLRLELL
eukprot:13069714-Alexandrium_andersonii.AAC.1